MGPGAGAGLRVRVTNAGISSDLFEHFSYNFSAPAVQDFSLALEQSGLGDQKPGNISGHFLAGDVLFLLGSNFGANPGVVQVFFSHRRNTTKCHVQAVNHTSLSCKTGANFEGPAAHGMNLPVRLVVAGQEADQSQNFFSYPPVPEVTSVSGCVDSGTTTTRCACIGGTRIIVGGRYFGFLSGLTSVLVDGKLCTSPEFHSSERISCIIPPGVGKFLSVSVTASNGLRSFRNQLLSYGDPVVTKISGCSAVSEQGVGIDCPRQNGVITVHGLNFGQSGATVLIGSSTCSNVVHDLDEPDGKLSCSLPTLNFARTVLVFQHGGGVSRRSGRVNYASCPPGTFNSAGFQCANCTPGRYSGEDATQCISCPAGKFSGQAGSEFCEDCPSGFYQSAENQISCVPCPGGSISHFSGSTHCSKCDSGFFELTNKCRPCLFGAICTNGLIQSKSNYWLLKSNSSVEAFRCSFGVCTAGKCIAGRTGLLCGSCVHGTYPMGKNCAPCEWKDATVLLLFITANYFLVLFIFFTSEESYKSNEGLVRIVFFFMQTLVQLFTVEELTTQFREALSLISLSAPLGSEGAQGTTFCYQWSVPSIVLAKLLHPVLSFTQLMLQLVFHYTVMAIMRRRIVVRIRTIQYRRAMVHLYVAAFFGAFTNSLRMFQCQDIGGESRLVNQPEILCDGNTYEELRGVAIGVLCLFLSVLLGLSWIFGKAFAANHLDSMTSDKAKIWLMLKEKMDARERRKILESSMFSSVFASLGMGSKRKSSSTERSSLMDDLLTVRIKRPKAGPMVPGNPKGFSHFNETRCLWQRYSVLTMPYRNECAFWEVYVMYVRVAIILLSVTVTNRQTKFVVFGLLFSAHLMVSSALRPYLSVPYGRDPVIAWIFKWTNAIDLLCLFTVFSMAELKLTKADTDSIAPLVVSFAALCVFVCFALIAVIAYREIRFPDLKISRTELEHMLGEVDEDFAISSTKKVNGQGKHSKSNSTCSTQTAQTKLQQADQEEPTENYGVEICDEADFTFALADPNYVTPLSNQGANQPEQDFAQETLYSGVNISLDHLSLTKNSEESQNLGFDEVVDSGAENSVSLTEVLSTLESNYDGDDIYEEILPFDRQNFDFSAQNLDHDLDTSVSPQNLGTLLSSFFSDSSGGVASLPPQPSEGTFDSLLLPQCSAEARRKEAEKIAVTGKREGEQRATEQRKAEHLIQANLFSEQAEFKYL